MDDYTTYVLRSEHLPKTVLTEDGHWLWGGPKLNGYGHIGTTRNYYLHRAAAAHFNKRSLKRGEVVRHLCNVRNCFAPTHLAVGTNGQNIQDAVRAGRVGDKLTTEQVREIRRRYQRYIKPLPSRGKASNRAELAAEYGVSASTVSRVVSGRKWGWLDG